jgi:hypothetical protein
MELLDATEDFFKLNPQYKTISPFDKYKKQSKLLWFVVFAHSKDSRLSKLPADERYGIVSEDICGDKDYYKKNQKDLDILIDAYVNLIQTPFERHLKVWEELLDKRTKFLQTQEYDLGTFESLDKMAIGTEKVYATFKKIMSDVEKEKFEDGIRGGEASSLND